MNYRTQSNSIIYNEKEEIKLLKHERSQLAIENEELKTQIYLLNFDLNKVSEEYQELRRIHEEKCRIHEEKEKKMSEQLDIVTKTAISLYEKIRAFKCRYYGNAWTHAQQR